MKAELTTKTVFRWLGALTNISFLGSKNAGFFWYVSGLPIILLVASYVAWENMFFPVRFTTNAAMIGMLYAVISVNRFKADNYMSYRAIGLSAFYTTAGFIIIFALLAMFRLHYSRVFMLSSYGFMIAWYTLGMLFFRGRVYNHLVIKSGISDKFSLLTRFNGVYVNLDDLENIDVSSYDGIVVDLLEHNDDSILRILSDLTLQGIPVLSAAVLYERFMGRYSLTNIVHENRYDLSVNEYYVVFKRIWETCVILLSAPLLLPLAVAVALGIKLESKGSVIFKQRRIGRNGKPFILYKFRSMQMNAEAEGAKFAKKGDSRITQFGKFIRSYRLDELPQLWNVVKGEMSLIGPRPGQEPYVRHFNEEIPFYAYRHVLRPGITGWAQIKGGYAADLNSTFRKLEYNLYYVKNINLSLDLVIIYATLKTIATRFGSR